MTQIEQQETPTPAQYNQALHPAMAGRDSVKRSLYTLSGSIILFSLIISGSIIFAAKYIIAPRINSTTQRAVIPQPAEIGTTQESTGPTTVSIDNDPVMGNIDAPVTIIEFGDFECPFCKTTFEELLPQLKKQYIDTGKVKLVYRDFPLEFHENAFKEAEAAECARDQGGDATYFKYHDQLYTQTKSNGTGLALTQLPDIAKSLGLSANQFQQCLDSNKYKNEVGKDLSDGIAAGVSGTPTWFIGKASNDGTMTTTPLSGAQPFAVFKTIIDQQLSQ